MSILPALPEIFLALVGMALLMLGVFTRRNERSRPSASSRWLPARHRSRCVVLSIPAATAWPFGGLFIVDGFARVHEGAGAGRLGAVALMSLGFIERESMARFEFPVLMLFATLGMMLMISANDLIALYLGLELQSLALYVVAAFQRDSLRSTEAGLKYFVLGALSSGMLLYGAR